MSRVLHAGRWATQQSRATRIGRGASEHCTHIELRNVPQTATPADIRRVVKRANLQGVSDVAIDYHHFKPTGRALLTLTHAGFLEPNIKALQKATIAGLPITAERALAPEVSMSRLRGGRGRAEAERRGVITGTGPHGGILNGGTNVTVWGFPGKITAQVFDDLLRGFKVADEEGQRGIVKIVPPDNQYTLVSRWLLYMKSTSEAHRLVRRLHMRHFRPGAYGKAFLIRARVIY